MKLKSPPLFATWLNDQIKSLLSKLFSIFSFTLFYILFYYLLDTFFFKHFFWFQPSYLLYFTLQSICLLPIHPINPLWKPYKTVNIKCFYSLFVSMYYILYPSALTFFFLLLKFTFNIYIIDWKILMHRTVVSCSST